MKRLLKERRNIPCAMQDPNNLNAICSRPIKNNVVVDGETAEFGCKVGSLSTQLRHKRKHLTFLTDGVEPMVRGGWIFVGNMAGDFDEIEICATGPQYAGHQLPFLFDRLRTFSFMLWISRGAKSPRLAWRIPMAISRRSSSWRRRCRSSDAPSQRYSSQRCRVESRFVADLTSATVLMRKNYLENEAVSTRFYGGMASTT